MSARSFLTTRRRPVAGALVCVLLVGLGAGVWLVVDPGEGRTPEGVVQAFFDARNDRDCERLVDLVSVASWPGGAELGRAGRVERCRAVVVADGPAPDQIELMAENDRTATVELSVPVDEDASDAPAGRGIVVAEPADGDAGHATRAYAEGSLVREQGEWKVQLDHAHLHLGRSVDEAIVGFADAFREGDCDGMADHLSQAAWPSDGGLSREDYLARCAAVVTASDDASPLFDIGLGDLTVDRMLVTPSGDGRATATIGWDRAGVETVSLRLEDGVWGLDAPLAEVENLELLALLNEYVDGGEHTVGLSEIVPPEGDPTDGLDLPEGADAAERRREHRFVRGIWGDYDGPESNSLHVLLFEFADPEGALAYGELLASRARRAPPGSPAPTPSVADGRAAVTECGGANGQDCAQAGHTVALGTRGRFFVGLEVIDADGTYLPAAEALARTEAILQAQLDRLP